MYTIIKWLILNAIFAVSFIQLDGFMYRRSSELCPPDSAKQNMEVFGECFPRHLWLLFIDLAFVYNIKRAYIFML